MDIDIETLTLAEIEELEELTDRSIDKMFDGPKARVLRALFYVVTKRTDPNFTFEDTASVTIHDAQSAMDPTNAAPLS